MCEYTLYARETNSSLGEYTAGKELVVAENTDIKKNQAIDLGIEDGTECIKLRNAAPPTPPGIRICWQNQHLPTDPSV